MEARVRGDSAVEIPRVRPFQGSSPCLSKRTGRPIRSVKLKSAYHAKASQQKVIQHCHR